VYVRKDLMDAIDPRGGPRSIVSDYCLTHAVHPEHRHTHSLSHTRKHTCVVRHVYAHTQSHAHTHKHTHTHTHTHTQVGMIGYAGMNGKVTSDFFLCSL
jgi:hypothetical protein